MADDRLFHKKLGHSEKVNLLSDIEDIAWQTYILAADDFGVMRFDALEIQNARERLARKPIKAVQKMLDRIRDVGLIRTFDHQRKTYCYQHDWQDFQKVRYAVRTNNPRIPDALLVDCTPSTQWLHTVWPGGGGREKKLANWKAPEGWAFRPCSGNGSVNVGARVPAQRARSHAVAIARDMAEGESAERGDDSADTAPAVSEPSRRAGAFCDWYADKHEQLFHVGYIGTQKDYQTALQLVTRLSDAELREAALVWFGQDDDFASKGTRTIPKFATRASGCLLQARQVKA